MEFNKIYDLLLLLQLSSSLMTASLLVVSIAFYLEVGKSNGNCLIQFQELSNPFDYFISLIPGICIKGFTLFQHFGNSFCCWPCGTLLGSFGHFFASYEAFNKRGVICTLI